MPKLYSTGSLLVSFPTLWSRTQSGSRNSIYFMNNSCNQPPLGGACNGSHCCISRNGLGQEAAFGVMKVKG